MRLTDRMGTEPLSTRIMLWTICLAALALGASAADRETGLDEMVGVWQIDHQVSDDPQRMFRHFDRERGQPGGGGGRGDGRPGPDFSQRAEMVTDGVNVLTISHKAGVLTITDWKDDIQALKVDGKKRQVERKGFSVEVEAGWKSSDRLVVRTKGPPGGWLRETYELGQRGAKLFVTIELQRRGSKYPVVFERLYNRSVAQ